MTEVRVEDWEEAVGWFETVLGLVVVLRDEPHGFALLTAGPGRLALKRSTDAASQGVRLVFRVADVDAEHARIAALGVTVRAPADHPREPYREVRLVAPGGLAVTLFADRAGA